MIHVILFEIRKTAVTTLKKYYGVNSLSLFLFTERRGLWKITHEFMFRPDSEAFLQGRFIISTGADFRVLKEFT